MTRSLPRLKARIPLALVLTAATAATAAGFLPTASASGSTYRTQVLNDHPAGFWQLDETSGSTAADALGISPGAYKNGTHLGVAGLLPADSSDRAASFDGYDDTAVVPSSSRLSPSSSVSLEAWVSPRSLPTSGNFASIVTKAESWSLQFNGPTLEFTVMQNYNRRRLQAPAGTVVAGGKYHVVGTYDGSYQRLYVNGRQVAARAQTGPATVSSYPVAIGSWEGKSENFNGVVDEVAVYPTALSATQASAHYGAGAGTGTTTTAPAPAPSSSSTAPAPSPSATAAAPAPAPSPTTAAPAPSPSPTTAAPAPSPTTAAPAPSPTSTAPASTSASAPLGVPGTWKLNFSDEFNGTGLDTSKWSTGWLGSGITKGANSAEQNCYDPAQVAVSGGSLSLTAIAKQESCGGKTQPYASGMINSNGKGNFTYGTYEARIYLPPAGAGTIANFPAWWMDGQNWPSTGEIDVMEGLSGKAAYHFHYSGGGPGATVPGDFTGWHTYSADWEPGSITYYYDGKKVGAITSGVTSAPMFMILNNAVSSQYGGPTVAPATMKVDYVRLWQH